MIKHQALALLAALFCHACHSQQEGCNQEQGNFSVSEGDYGTAFELLRDCEFADGVTGLTLGQLAVLYGDFGFGSFVDERNRWHKVYELYVRSARKGNEDAMVTVISMFKEGESVMSLEPQQQKADCLAELLNSGVKFTSEQVSGCLDG